jgi:hypothetical protein
VLLCRAEQAVPGVAHDYVDPPGLGEGTVDDLMDGLGVGHVEQLRPELLRVAIGRRPCSCRVRCPRPLVTSLEQLLAELASEAAADASNAPCALCHLVSFAQVLQDAHSARHDSACGTPCSALWAAIRRARLTASSLPSPRGRPSAAHHVQLGVCPARWLCGGHGLLGWAGLGSMLSTLTWIRPGWCPLSCRQSTIDWRTVRAI